MFTSVECSLEGDECVEQIIGPLRITVLLAELKM